MPELSGGRQILRCFCSYNPILAVVGVDPKDNRTYVHQKVYKQTRLYAESFHKGGEVSIRCRVCYRMHTVIIREDGNVNFEPNLEVETGLPIASG